MRCSVGGRRDTLRAHAEVFSESMRRESANERLGLARQDWKPLRESIERLVIRDDAFAMCPWRLGTLIATKLKWRVGTGSACQQLIVFEETSL